MDELDEVMDGNLSSKLCIVEPAKRAVVVRLEGSGDEEAQRVLQQLKNEVVEWTKAVYLVCPEVPERESSLNILSDVLDALKELSEWVRLGDESKAQEVIDRLSDLEQGLVSLDRLVKIMGDTLPLDKVS